jgi:hypothetical protein
MKYLFIAFVLVGFSCKEESNKTQQVDSENLLVAERNAPARCLTTLKLKENKTFIEESTCFGMSNKIEGTYQQNGDTIIFFANVKYAEFAILEQYPNHNGRYKGALTKYKHINDTIGYTLGVVLNELNK